MGMKKTDILSQETNDFHVLENENMIIDDYENIQISCLITIQFHSFKNAKLFTK